MPPTCTAPPLRRRLQEVALLTGIMVALLASWAAFSAGGSAIAGAPGGDFHSIAWGLDRVAQAWPGLPSLRVADISVPRGATLMVADLPEAWLLAPLTLWQGTGLSFHVLQILHPALATALCFGLLRTEGRRPVSALADSIPPDQAWVNHPGTSTAFTAPFFKVSTSGNPAAL